MHAERLPHGSTIWQTVWQALRRAHFISPHLPEFTCCAQLISISEAGRR